MSFFKEEFDKFMNERGDSMTEEEKDRLNEIRNAGKLIVDFMLQYVKGVKSTKGLFELENDIKQKMQEKYSQRECLIAVWVFVMDELGVESARMIMHNVRAELVRYILAR